MPPVTRLTRTATTIGALLGIACAVLTGCAQPGQLGSPEPTPAPVPAAAPVPPAPAPGIDARGLVQVPVSVRTPGPAVFSVRTVTMAPGETTGWRRLPGTATSIVTSGAVTVLTGANCAGTRFATGDAVFVADARSQLVRNDGDAPATLVVTTLLAPGVPQAQDVPDPC